CRACSSRPRPRSPPPPSSGELPPSGASRPWPRCSRSPWCWPWAGPPCSRCPAPAARSAWWSAPAPVPPCWWGPRPTTPGCAGCRWPSRWPCWPPAPTSCCAATCAP
ncbi:MAG: hypothetical protein AVDCRST_MAG35-1981, partial [uncultured Quadrisphaera sp.]